MTLESNTFPIIITHSDTFHCDEVMGTAMLEYLYGTELQILRTRDEEKLIKIQNDEFSKYITLDVGQIYDPERKLYDHHQTTFTEKWDDSKASTPLSSCGLIWKHYGVAIINKKLEEIDFLKNFNDTMKHDFYYYFVHGIDANDNGVSKYDNPGKSKYLNSLELGWVINKFNSDNVYDNEKQLVQFRKAVNHCKNVLEIALEKSLRHSIIYEKDKNNFKIDYSLKTNPEILIVKSRYDCINEYLYEIDPNQETKFIIVPRGTDQKQIWTVNKRGSQFENLVKIISQDKATALVGDKCVFVHKARFTGSFKDETSAIKVCEESLAEHLLLLHDPVAEYLIIIPVVIGGIIIISFGVINIIYNFKRI